MYLRYDIASSYAFLIIACPKGGVFRDPEWKYYFTVFPAKIWIFKFFLLTIFAIKMLLDNTQGLLNLFEFKNNHLYSLFQAEYEFKNSNYGGKYSEILFSLWISKNTAFSM